MKEREAAKWLQELTNTTCWGHKKFDREKGKFIPKYANLNRDLIAWFSFGKCRFTQPRKLSQKALIAHFQDRSPADTLYFTGSCRSQSLLMIDIDCHRFGSLLGAITFAKHLRDHYFPQLYFEPSTNGNGVHGYLIVSDAGNAKEYNETAKMLEHWLKAVLYTNSFDVEDVEIKGTSAVIERHNGKVVNFKEGTLAKYPRDVSRSDEWKQTTRISAQEIWSLVERSTIRPLPKKEACRPGSISGKHIDPEMIKALLPFGLDLLGAEKVSTGSKNRAVVTTEDVAVFATLLKFFHENPNSDGTLPGKRMESLWKSLYECGDISRAWEYHRYKWIRDKFTEHELIDWVDSTYVVGDKKNGIVGVACKWDGSEKFLNIIEEYTCVANNCDTTSTSFKEERSILGWSKQLKKEYSSSEKKEMVLIRPVRVFKMPWRWEDHAEKVDKIVQETTKRLEIAA